MPRILGAADTRRSSIVVAICVVIVIIFLLTLKSSTDTLERSQLQHGSAESAKQQQQQQANAPHQVQTVTVVQKEVTTATVTATVTEAAPMSTAVWRNPLALTRDECIKEFPGLFDEIERVVRLRNGRQIEEKELENDKMKSDEGYARVLIFEGKMYILEQRDESGFSRRQAALHALHDAIATSPDQLPNIEFVLNVWDTIDNSALAWSLARKITQEPVQNNWLMPDFGLWSWPEPKVGSFDEVLKKSDAVDAQYRKATGEYTLDGKKDLAVWRGALLGGVQVRHALFKAIEGKQWADVKELNWGNKEELKQRLLTMADHCRYKYLLHAEGYSYSGRLKYLQTCHSVIVSHELEWAQHYFPLMVDSGPAQNYVKVKRDWSDLEEKITWLHTHPKEADEIAARGRAVMRKYQSQSANNCYWREMIRAWSELQGWKASLFKTADDGKPVWRGVPWESFAIMKKVDWDPA